MALAWKWQNTVFLDGSETKTHDKTSVLFRELARAEIGDYAKADPTWNLEQTPVPTPLKSNRRLKLNPLRTYKSLSRSSESTTGSYSGNTNSRNTTWDDTGEIGEHDEEKWQPNTVLEDGAPDMTKDNAFNGDLEYHERYGAPLPRTYSTYIRLAEEIELHPEVYQGKSMPHYASPIVRKSSDLEDSWEERCFAKSPQPKKTNDGFIARQRDRETFVDTMMRHPSEVPDYWFSHKVSLISVPMFFSRLIPMKMVNFSPQNSLEKRKFVQDTPSYFDLAKPSFGTVGSKSFIDSLISPDFSKESGLAVNIDNGLSDIHSKRPPVIMTRKQKEASSKLKVQMKLASILHDRVALRHPFDVAQERFDTGGQSKLLPETDDKLQFREAIEKKRQKNRKKKKRPKKVLAMPQHLQKPTPSRLDWLLKGKSDVPGAGAYNIPAPALLGANASFPNMERLDETNSSTWYGLSRSEGYKKEVKFADPDKLNGKFISRFSAYKGHG